MNDDPVNGRDDDGNGYVDDEHGWDFVDGDADPRDVYGHGTHVAGIIGARGDDATGVVGVSWQVSLMAVRALDAAGSATAVDLAEAFEYARDNGAQIVNGSFGGPRSRLLDEAIAASPGVLFVVSAGNEGRSTAEYPCRNRAANLVCVAASNRQDRLAWFSSYGRVAVDLAAPGVEIVSSAPARAPLLLDDFEHRLEPQWRTVTRGAGEPWGVTTRHAVSGSWSATDSPRGPYADDAVTSIESARSMDLTGLQGCQLDYEFLLDLEYRYDWLYVEGSDDGKHWVRIDGWTGSTDGRFGEWSEDFSLFDGEPTVFVRFTLETDSGVVRDGVYLDDVRLRCLSPAFGPDDYTSFDGTSMSAAYVSGVAALVKAQAPWLSPTDIRSVILENVDRIPSFEGRIATAGRLNAYRAVAAAAALRSPAGESLP